jgi:hypothetical protein
VTTDFPPFAPCGFCGETIPLSDRRRYGARWIIAGFLVGFITGWYFGWIVGIMDWLLLFAFGLYSVLRKDRYFYRCKECTNVISPYDWERKSLS